MQFGGTLNLLSGSKITGEGLLQNRPGSCQDTKLPGPLSRNLPKADTPTGRTCPGLNDNLGARENVPISFKIKRNNLTIRLMPM